MRKGFLATLSTVLAGTSIVLADSPQTAEQKTATNDPRAAVAAKTRSDEPQPSSETSRSPYWPNPLAQLECLPPMGPCLDGHPAIESPYGEDGKRKEMVWVNAEFLLWWVQNTPLPTPLVTTGTVGGFGILGNSGTSVVFGGNDVDFRTLAGARFTAGFWFERGCDIGLEGSGFFLEKGARHFDASSDPNGNPLLARPVINAQTGRETVELITVPNIATGSANVAVRNGFYGWDLNFVDRLYKEGDAKLELLGGFRFVHLDEVIEILQNSALLPGGIDGFGGVGIAPPANVRIFDQIATVNRFYGGQLGTRYEYNSERLFLNVLGKVAIGNSHEAVNLGGASATTPTGRGRTRVVPGGLLVLPTNFGRTSKDEFAVVPEIGLNVGYHVTPLLRAYIGYNFLYWSDVARPGDQIVRTVNPALVPTSRTFGIGGGPAQPAPLFQRTDFWAQGINFGLELRY
jgi:hypothetical protein